MDNNIPQQPVNQQATPQATADTSLERLVDAAVDAAVLNAAQEQQVAEQPEAVAKDVVEEPEVQTQTLESALNEVLGGQVTSVKVRLINNVSLVDHAEEIEEFAESLDTVQLEGKEVCLYNLLRKGKQDKSEGFMRKPLMEIVGFLTSIANQNVTLLGDNAEITDAVQNLAQFVGATVDASMHQKQDEDGIVGSTVVIGTEAEQADDMDDMSEDAEQAVSVTSYELDVSSITSASVYPTMNEDGTLVITVKVNMRMIALAKHEDKARFLRQINKVISGIMTHSGAEFELRNTLAVSADLLVDQSVRTMLDELLGGEEPEFEIYSADQIRNTLKAGVHFDILPYGRTISETMDTLFPYGGDFLLMQS